MDKRSGVYAFHVGSEDALVFEAPDMCVTLAAREWWLRIRAFRVSFVTMLRATESCLFHLSVCDVATNSLNKFFSSVIARLNAVRDDGGNISEAYEAILLGEEGTARRMPSDAEFERALRTRDCYAFKRGFYLLTTLENSWHAKPLNALASAEWREMLGDDCERVYEELINTLGNLTLTAYNSELSDVPSRGRRRTSRAASTRAAW